MHALPFRSATDLVATLRAGDLGSRELLDAYLDRIEEFNPALNAVVTLDVDRARRDADAADSARARGDDLGPLHGLPMTVKDNLETAHVRSTAGANHLADHVPATDALVVERLRAAGAIIFGKTNLPSMGMDAQTYNDIFGTTNNPWNLDRSPGGSSGGAAAAVAAGLTGLDIGTDIGGSIRSPAHYAGVYGHKPTYGIVARRGHLGAPGIRSFTDLSVIGPIGRGADDLALTLDVIAGPDPEEEGIAYRLTLPPARQGALRDYRVAAWLDDPCCPTDAEVLRCLQDTVAALREAGVEVDDTARPPFDPAAAYANYLSLLGAATSAGPSDETYDLYISACEHLPDDDSYMARFPRVITQRHRHWLHAREERAQLRARWQAFFKDYDVMLTPVTCVPALPHLQEGEQVARVMHVNGTERPYLDQLFWSGLVTGPHLPATSAPVGCTSDGLPVGIQIIGPYLEDRTPIDFAIKLAEVHGGFVPPPGY